MSSKGASAMGEENNEKSALVPRLRFPEFREAGEWEEKTVEELSENVTAGGTPDTSEARYWNGKIRWMNSGELNHKRVYEVQGRITDSGFKNSSTKLIPEKSVLIGLAGQGKTRGTVAMNMVELCINQSIAAIFPDEHKFSSDFLYHNLDNRYDELRRLSAGSEGRGGLNLQIIKSLGVPLPRLEEQQKIADCLSSLDELITAETQKLDALKTHKKGLMQQLFPRGGETVPRLRFPEFREAGEWEVRPFGDLLDDVIDFRGRTPTKLGMEWGGGNIPALSANNVKNGFIDYNAECYLGSEELYLRWMGEADLEKEDIVFTMEAPLGNASLLPDSRKYILSQRVVAFKTKTDVLNPFLVQVIWGDGFQNEIGKLATGSTAKGINQKSLRTIPVRLPNTDEQQKIADCLSPLDDLITTQTRKIDALKTHKKGLMQQLFPALEEAQA